METKAIFENTKEPTPNELSPGRMKRAMVAVVCGLLFTASSSVAQWHFEDAMQPADSPGTAFVYPGGTAVGHQATVTAKDGVVWVRGNSSTDPTYVGDPYNYLRAGIHRPDVDYQNFIVSVDLLGWESPPMNPGDPIQGFAVFGRGSQTGAAGANYYALEVIPNANVQGEARLHLCAMNDGVAGELRERRDAQGQLTTETFVDLNSTGAYRMVLMGAGSDLVGELIDVASDRVIAVVVGADDRHSHGNVGFLAYDRQGLMGARFGAIDAVFADFDATEIRRGEPDPVEPEPGDGTLPGTSLVPGGAGSASQVSGQIELRADAIEPSAVGGRAHVFTLHDIGQVYQIQEGQSLTVSADLLAINQDNALAGIGFTDSHGRGYFFSKDENELRVIKTLGEKDVSMGESAVLFWDFPNSIPNRNVTMELTLTAAGPDVLVDARVIEAGPGSDSVLFEVLLTDTPGDDSVPFDRDTGPMIGSPDNSRADYRGASVMPVLSLDHFDLAVDAADSMDASWAVFDNFTVTMSEMTPPEDPGQAPDDGSADPDGEPLPESVDPNELLFDWTISGEGSAFQTSTQVAIRANPLTDRYAYGRSHTVSVESGNPSYVLGSDTGITLQVELVSANQNDAVAGIGFAPLAGTTGYFFSKDEDELRLEKAGTAGGPGEVMFWDGMLYVDNENVVLSLTLEGREDGIAITARVLDSEPDAQGDPRVLFENQQFDPRIPGFSAETGRLVLFLNHADRTPDNAPLMPASEVVFDHATVISSGEPLPVTDDTP